MNIQIQPGLGDAIYNYPIIRELAKQQPVVIETGYPEIFIGLSNVTAVKQIDERIDLKLRFHILQYPAYNQLCAKANLWPEFDFNGFLDENYHWMPGVSMDTNNKKLCIIKEPCASGLHKGKQNFKEAADHKEMQDWIDANRNEYFFVSVGKDEVFMQRLKVDLDLNNQLSITDLIILCSHAQLIATQIGHLVAIGCAFRVPLKIFKAIGNSELYHEKRLNCVIVPNTSRLV